MIILPRNITQTVFSIGKNVIRRCYGQEEIRLDNTNSSIVTRTPFVVEQEGKRILFTSNPNEIIPDDCPYAILVNRKPTSKLFYDGAFKSYEWLKHPNINDTLSSEEIAKSWRGVFRFIEEDNENGLP